MYYRFTHILNLCQLLSHKLSAMFAIINYNLYLCTVFYTHCRNQLIRNGFMNILFTTRLPIEGLVSLNSIHCELIIPNTPYFTEEELLKHLPQADILVSTFDYRITQTMITNAPHLRLIANFGVGYNNIDLDACRERNIMVTNTPQPVIEPTAELAFALMLCVARRVAEFDNQLKANTAEPFGVMNNLSHSLYGKTLGIVGMGRIGQSVARRAVASGMHILYYNRHRLPADIEQQYGAQYTDFDTLLQDADFVSLHLPYTPAVKHLISTREFALMKPTACIINTARGAHINEQALVTALQQHQIAGAALDVYENEPQITPALKSMPNVILSPHTGTGTWEGRLAMCNNVCTNILAFTHNDYTQMDRVI